MRKTLFGILIPLLLIASVSNAQVQHRGAERKVLIALINDVPPSKLTIAARKAGVRIESIDATKLQDLSGYSAVFILGNDLQSSFSGVLPNALTKLYSYVKSGGAVFAAFGVWNSDVNDRLLDLYNVGLANESVVSSNSNLIFDGGDLFAFWSGLKVGGAKAMTGTFAGPVRIQGFADPIAAPDPATGPGVASRSNSKPRRLTAISRIGTGKFVVMITTNSGDCYYCDESPFSDGLFDELDNAEAFSRLLAFLLSK